MRKTYVIFVKLCMRWTHLATLKGSNSSKNVKKIYNFNLKYANGLFRHNTKTILSCVILTLFPFLYHSITVSDEVIEQSK